MVLADFAPTANGAPALDPTDVIRGMRALTGVGAALLASNALLDWTEAMRDRRVDDAGARLGVDLTAVEGRLAATAYALVQEGISSGGYPVLPKNPEFARIGAEAAALYELMNPGTILETGVGGDPAKQRALQEFIEAAGAAFARGDLRFQGGELAQGWVEIFPELTEDERRLGELRGFTPERIEQWLESYPIEELGPPNNTGTPIPGDPTDNVISTPIPDETGPNIVAMENPHSIESISIPEDRARHILDGEGRSGGHRFGTGTPGKTEFPESWSDDDILDAIREVAGNGTVDRPAHRPGDLVIVGEVDGVTIKVIVRPNGEVRTGYPVSGDGVLDNLR